MRIIVGCPVRDRAWVLPHWFQYIEEAFSAIGEEPEYAFVIGTCTDNSLEVIRNHTSNRTWISSRSEEPPIDMQYRQWGEDRYVQMTAARNELLSLVRHESPDLFLSIDSDILINPNTLPLLIEDLNEFDAVGGKLYMTPDGVVAPSYAFYQAMGGLIRPDADGFLSLIHI